MAIKDQSYWEAGNGISASEGVAFLTVNGRNYDLFYLNSLESKIKKNKKELKVFGRRGTGNKTIGWSGSGTLSIKKTTSFFNSMFLDYVQQGIDVYFSITLTNEDSSTPYGRETKTLLGCNFDEIDFAGCKADDLLEQELAYTFEGVEMPEKFNEI